MPDGIGDIEMKRCVVGIRRPGESEVATKGRDVPTVWLPSMATMAAVLSEDNPALLRIIRDAKPKTLTELAALSGRQVPNLSRTLRMMSGYGLVELKRNAREIAPITLATEFLVVLD
jgi:predicted transcriptional regulator